MIQIFNQLNKWVFALALLWPMLVVAENQPGAEPAQTNTAQGSALDVAKPTAEANKKVAEKVPSFNVFEYVVEGNTVLDKGKVEEAVYPYLGESKTIEDVEKARSALEKAYQDAGYLTVSVSIPQQDVDENFVKLLVTEGSVERLRVTESKYTSLAEVKSRVAEFAEGKVPHFPTAQKELGTVNRGQNRQVTPILRAGKTPGKVEVDLKVQDQLPLHGSLELNDKYSSNTTRTRLNGSVRYENLWQKDHSLGLSFQVSPEDLNEVKVISGTYVIPRMNGDYFAAYGVISKSNISAVGDVSVIGDGQIAGIRYIHPLPLLDHYYHSLTLGADYKDFKESILLGADTSKTPISYTALSLGYDANYSMTDAQAQANVTVNFAPRGIGNENKEFDDKRTLAKANYVYLRTDLKYTQKLLSDWSMQARLGAQLANQPLISAEQFAIGGVDSVRGYLESSELGDNGVSGTIELRTPPLIKYLNNSYFKDNVKELYAYGFLDAGYVSIYDALASQDESNSLSSLGLGVKLKATKGLFGNLDYAHALNDSGVVKSGDDRVHFKVGYEW